MCIWIWYECSSRGYVLFPITSTRFRRFWIQYMAKKVHDIHFFIALFLGFLLSIWYVNENIRSQIDYTEHENMKLCKQTIPAIFSSFNEQKEIRYLSLKSALEWISIQIAHQSCQKFLTSRFWVPLAYSLLNIGISFSFLVLIFTFYGIELYYSRKNSHAFFIWLYSRLNYFSIYISFFFLLCFSAFIIYWAPARLFGGPALHDEVLKKCQRVITQIVISNNLPIYLDPVIWCKGRFVFHNHNFIENIFIFLILGIIGFISHAFVIKFTNLNNYFLWRLNLEENAWIQSNLIEGFTHPEGSTSPLGDSKNVVSIIKEYFELE